MTPNPVMFDLQAAIAEANFNWHNAEYDGLPIEWNDTLEMQGANWRNAEAILTVFRSQRFRDWAARQSHWDRSSTLDFLTQLFGEVSE